MNTGIELDGITRIVEGELHLADIDLTLSAGSFNVLLGRTRAGKTSLLRLLAGLDRPTRGAVRFNGTDVTRLDVRRRNVAMVYQQFVNYPSLTVYENIASPLRLAKKLSDADLDRRVRETAKVLRLDNLLQRLPAELSGGQQQRTAMARALVKDADLLLLDEPLANLDYKLREELRTEIRQLFQSRGAVVVYATTEPAEALLLGGRVAVLDEGRVLQSGPVVEVYGAPATERVGQVFSDPQMNVLDAEVTSGGEVQLPAGVAFPLSGHLRGLSPGRYRLGIRANHVRLSSATGGGPGSDRGSSTDVRVPVIVEVEEVSGSETLVHATCGPNALAALIEGVHQHALGSSLEMLLAPERLFVWSSDGRLVASPPLRPPSSSIPDTSSTSDTSDTSESGSRGPHGTN